MLYKSKGKAKFTVCPVPLLTIYQLEFASSLVKLTEDFLEAQASCVWESLDLTDIWTWLCLEATVVNNIFFFPIISYPCCSTLQSSLM